MQNKTFAIIKPDAIENKYTGKIIDRILNENFNIIEARLIKMNKNQAEEFYGIHKERPFFNDLVSLTCALANQWFYGSRKIMQFQSGEA